MSAGIHVDTLGGLTEKLKQLINDTQEQYEAFIDATQLYKKGKVNEKEYFSKIGDYLIATSTVNFLAVQVIFEIKSAIEKGPTIKSPTSAFASPTSQPTLGVASFAGTGGTAERNDYTMSAPAQTEIQEPASQGDIPVGHLSEKNSARIITSTKKCMHCGSGITERAKFCNKCGNSQ
jgi:hypothetical protein